jgi:hypothetical protein
LKKDHQAKFIPLKDKQQKISQQLINWQGQFHKPKEERQSQITQLKEKNKNLSNS